MKHKTENQTIFAESQEMESEVFKRVTLKSSFQQEL